MWHVEWLAISDAVDFLRANAGSALIREKTGVMIAESFQK